MNCQTRPQPRSFHFIFSTILLAAIVACGTAHAQTETAISYGISYAGSISDSSGNLYGVTLLGGSQNCGQLDGCGTVIELSPAGGATWAANVLYSFQGLSDGFAPYGGVVFDAAGNLYGTTQVGGNGGGGTVFKLYLNGTGTWNLTTLYSFVAPNDALYPNSTLIFDHAGNLYGTAAGGGKYGKGAVFELSPASHGPWKKTILQVSAHPAAMASPPTVLLQ